ncbi:GIP, partial [Symbiodinium sp. KB8]
MQTSVVQQGVSPGDRAFGVQQGVSPGDRAFGLQQGVFPGDRAFSVQQGVPPGDRALSLQQDVPLGDRALSLQQGVPPGDRAFSLQQGVPPGDRAFSLQQDVPPGDRAFSLQQDVPPGDRALSLQYDVPPGVQPPSVHFEADQTVDQPMAGVARNTPAAYPFSGLLQSDVCGASGGVVPPAAQSPQVRLRGDYGARHRSRTPSRERTAYPPPPPPGIPPRLPEGRDKTTGAGAKGGFNSSSNPLETLVAGMTQIQEVLLKGRSGGETAEYDPSKSVAEFSKLKENSTESGAIDFQDWLYLVEQQVGSMASGASVWWNGMVAAAMAAYGRYQASTPIQRLSISAELPAELEDAKFSKLEKRVAALLVASLPQAMREEMVAYRVRRVHQQLFRLLVCYQPGGSSDRALVLSQLDPKDGSTDVGEVAASLRRWFRWLQRAQDLQLSLPDPSIQIKALTSLTKKLADRNSDFQFKISLARTELRVDSRPSQDTALRYFQHLLAEQMGPTKAKPPTAAAALSAQAMAAAAEDAQQRPRAGQGQQPKAPMQTPTSPKEGKGEGKGSCKWFVSEQGCSRGRACRYLHDWSQVVKAERCLVCGSKLHKVKDCPRKDQEPGSDSPGPRGLNRKELRALASMSSSSTGQGSAAPPMATAKQQPPPPPPASIAMTPAAKAAADPPLQPAVTSDSLKEMLVETTKALKALSMTSAPSLAMPEQSAPAVQDPLQLLSRRLNKFTLKSLDERMALLDSGASHAYRKAHNGEECNRARPVSVKLAEGETTLLQTEAGTLLGDNAAETLVPLGQLVEVLGCTVQWSKNRLVVTHPVHGRLKVQVRDFCPQLAEQQALKLIAELEEKRLRDFNKAVYSLELKMAQSDREMEWFEYVQDYVVKGDRVDLLAAISKAPFFQDYPIEMIATAAEGIPVQERDGWLLLKSMPWSRLAVTSATGVNVDVDLLDSNLLNVTRMDGIYKLLLWAAAQGRIRTLIGGPPRRSYLKEDEQRRDKEEQLLARMLILGTVAMEGRRQYRSERVGVAIEHPDYESEGGSFWQSSMWKEFAECYSLELIRSGKGSTGTNFDGRLLYGVPSTTAASGRWTDEYVEWMGEAVNGWTGYSLHDSILCSVAVDKEDIKLGKMTAKEWQLHLRPFRSKGLNTETNQYKFMLVCAYQFPRLPETPADPREPIDDGGGVGEIFREEDEEFDGVAGPLSDEFAIVGDDANKEHAEVDEEGKEVTKEEREAREASEPLEFSVAYFVRPLRSRRSGEVLRALQEVYIDVKMLGLPVNRLHADRAREFRTPAVSEWAAARDVQVTRTEGDTPAQNGVAEQAVKYIKARTRILLTSAQELSGRDIKEVKTWWPLAAETVAVRQRALAFGQDSKPPAGFGHKVFVKRKKYGAEARDLDPKWSEATYLGPARDVPGGHVVLTDDDHLWNTCNVRLLPDVPMEPDPADVPARKRIFGKRPPPPVVPIAVGRATLSAMRTKASRAGPCEVVKIKDEKSVAKIEYLPAKDLDKTLAQVSMEREWFSLGDCLSVVEDIPFKKPNQTRVADAWGDPGPDVYVALGAYQHGSFVGITNATRRYSWLTKYLAEFLKVHAGTGDPFTSIVLAKNLGTRLHRDKYNIDGRRNIVVTFGSCNEGGLWVEGEHDEYPRLPQRLSDGVDVQGTVLPSKGNVVKFDPRRLHCSTSWTGIKWSVIGYCNRGVNRMDQQTLDELKSFGFPLPEIPRPSLLQLRNNNDQEEFDHCGSSDEEEHFLSAQISEEELVRLRQVLDEEEIIESWMKRDLSQEEQEEISQANVLAMRRCERMEANAAEQLQQADNMDSLEWLQLCRLVEGGEQHGIEELLRSLDSPLQVVYTFTLAEVRENVGAWKKAIMKEVQALISCGALTKLEPEEEDRLNRTGALVVLPAKVVFTAKPPDQAPTNGVQTKSSDQIEFPDGVQTKSSDQLEFPDGVQTKSSDQLEFPDGVQTKSSVPVVHAEGQSQVPVDALYKRKARLVICGNFEKHITEELYAGGCQTETVRIMISHVAGKPSWDAAITDVRNAFLLAPMSTDAVYGLRFPKVFLLALGAEWDFLYRVDRALYGFRRSPRLWGSFRDGRLRGAKLWVNGKRAILRRLVADENVWQLIYEESSEPQEALAYLIVYVDDIMYLGEPQTIQQLHEWLSSEWTSSPLLWASSEDGIRFLGLEIYKVKSGYRMCQLGYIKELLRHHGLSEGPGARTPCPREWLLGDGEIEQKAYDERSLRKAQQMTGELLWLSTKSRPDLMHSVASMSSLCLRDPILVERIGSRVLSYLHTTAHLSLMFGTAGADGPHDVIAYSDASFSPSGGRSIGCSLVTYHGNAAAWRSGRQSLVALSTAEAELIEAVASVQLQAGIAALTCEINLVPIRRALYVDNSASVGLCTDSPGTWRLYDLRNMWGLIKYEEAESQQSGREDKVLVVLYCVTQPVAGKKAKPDIEVTFPWELYGLVFLLVIAGIAVWEVVKKIWSRLQPDESESREARRL